MSKPSVLAAAWRLAPSIKSAILFSRLVILCSSSRLETQASVVAAPHCGKKQFSPDEELHQHGSKGCRRNVVSLTFEGKVLRIRQSFGNCLHRMAEPHIALLTIHHKQRHCH